MSLECSTTTFRQRKAIRLQSRIGPQRSNTRRLAGIDADDARFSRGATMKFDIGKGERI